MLEPSIVAIRQGKGNSAAVVFVHGFMGNGLKTWRNLSGRIADEPRLPAWDFWTVTYGSKAWIPDVSGIWTADADLSILAERLATHLQSGTLAGYKSVVLIAHSMGGLIVQKALVDYPKVAKRVHAVILFGTPSGGLVKARAGWFWKRQLADMAKSGPFITSLRADWQKRFSKNRPFWFLAVAGERDQFVPPEYLRLAPFPRRNRLSSPATTSRCCRPMERIRKS